MIQAYFSSIRATITNYIESSTSEICIAVAWFTHRDMFHAVLNALNRKVKVSIIVIDDIINRGPNGLDFGTYIANGGEIRYMSTRKLLMHNKFCLFDKKYLITGSYNWTYSAEGRNAENIIVTDEENVCSAFHEYFKKLWNELPLVEQFCRIEFSDLASEDFLNCYDYLCEEYKSMENAQLSLPFTVNDVKSKKNNFSIAKLNTIVTNTKRSKPILKKNIGKRCRINGVNNQTLNIIKQGQLLPYTNRVSTKTAYDNQKSVTCEILYGNSKKAKDNESLLKIQMDNLPPSKAGKVKFSTEVSLLPNGNMYIEFKCKKTGITLSATYNAIDKIDYQ